MRKQAQPAKANTDQPRKEVSGQLGTDGIGDIERHKNQGDLGNGRAMQPKATRRSDPEIRQGRPDGTELRGDSERKSAGTGG